VIADEPSRSRPRKPARQAWEPKNYDGKYEGPMSMRTALAKSKNMVSIRLLRSIGTHYAQDYVTRFGFEAGQAPALPDHGPGRRRGDALAATFRLFHIRQWRLPHHALYRAPDPRRQGFGAGRAKSQPSLAGDETCARSTRAMPG
jgi:penicillin-binding protein 1A